MRLPLATALLSLLTSPTSASSNADLDVTLYSWPLLAKSPTPFVTISYDSQLFEYSTRNYKAPSTSPPASTSSDGTEQHLTRIGLYNSKTKKWSGVLTQTAAFQSTTKPTITLFLDDKGQAQHIGLQAYSATSSNVQSGGPSKPRGQVDIEVVLVKAQPGPEPQVNKPVMVDADGKVPEPVIEKSLLQKYWWVLAGLVMLALVSGGPDK